MKPRAHEGRARERVGSPPAPVRLQKRLAESGFASRREAERLIAEGRVTIGGRVATIGEKVSPDVEVAVDGKPVLAPSRPITILLYKPDAVVTARSDPQGRKTVYDLLPPDLPFLSHVGRLDYHTEGVLLMTTDGRLGEALLRPGAGVTRVYDAKVRGHVGRETLRRLEAGVPLDGRPTRPVIVERLPGTPKHDRLRLTLVEGRNRHVRRILEEVGHPVQRLRRIAFGGLEATGLRPGSWRFLTPEEVANLRALVR